MPADPSVSPAALKHLDDWAKGYCATLRLSRSDAAAFLAVGERDKAELSGLRVEFGEWVKAIHEAFAEREVDPQSDGPGRIRRLVLERQQAEERGERDRRQIAQLIEALREARPIVASVAYEFDAPADSKVLEQIDAVLADEEDAANG